MCKSDRPEPVNRTPQVDIRSTITTTTTTRVGVTLKNNNNRVEVTKILRTVAIRIALKNNQQQQYDYNIAKMTEINNN